MHWLDTLWVCCNIRRLSFLYWTCRHLQWRIFCTELSVFYAVFFFFVSFLSNVVKMYGRRFWWKGTSHLWKLYLQCISHLWCGRDVLFLSIPPVLQRYEEHSWAWFVPLACNLTALVLAIDFLAWPIFGLRRGLTRSQCVSFLLSVMLIALGNFYF